MSDFFKDVAAFPLCWPDGWSRTKNRQPSRFKVSSVYEAVEGLRVELAALMERCFSAGSMNGQRSVCEFSETEARCSRRCNRDRLD